MSTRLRFFTFGSRRLITFDFRRHGASVKRQFSRSHRAEFLFEHLFDFSRLDAAEDGNHSIFCHEVSIAKSQQVFRTETADRLCAPFRPQSKWMLRKQSGLQLIARHRSWLFVFFLDSGQLISLSRAPRPAPAWWRSATRRREYRSPRARSGFVTPT